MTENNNATASGVTKQEVEQIITDAYGDRVFRVEENTVWVSGMNSSPRSLAQRFASELTAHDIPCSLVDNDDATQFGGFEFRYGEAA